jgi:hypothetical protein
MIPELGSILESPYRGEVPPPEKTIGEPHQWISTTSPSSRTCAAFTD